MPIRGFEKITKYQNVNFPLPRRKTTFSAGYDMFVPEQVVLKPGVVTLVPTGVKAYMQEGEFLGLHIRSSAAIKRGLRLVNNVGIIDADYYNNPDNEGHIMVAIENTGKEVIVLEKDECIAQGIFCNYLLADGDAMVAKSSRMGGIGSTGK